MEANLGRADAGEQPRGTVRLPGYCTVCRRIKQVRVSGHGMAMLGVRRVAQGICSQCEQDEIERRTGKTQR